MKSIVRQHLNPFFFIPFFIWCIVGAVLLLQYSQKDLFVFINGNHHPVLDKFMESANYLGEGWGIVLIGLSVFLLKPFRNVWFFLTTALCTILPALITQLIKHQVAAPRPISVFGHESWLRHLDEWALLHNNSFPSGHTTGAFSLMCFLSCAIVFRHRALGLVFFVVALSVAYARVYLAAHFFLDVYVGSIIGTGVSFLVSILVFRYKEHRHQKKIVQP